MTVPYEATDRKCIECGEAVEDYTGHSSASEMTACEQCHGKVEGAAPYSVDIVHCVPRRNSEGGANQ